MDGAESRARSTCDIRQRYLYRTAQVTAMDEHVARMQRFNEWLPKFEARLAENRRQMKIYCAIAKLKKLRDRPADSAGAGHES